MTVSPHNSRIIKLVALVGAVAAALAANAQATVMEGTGGAGGQLRSSAIVDLRSPDRVHPARDWAYVDAGERAIVTAPQSSPSVIDLRSADTRDAVYGIYPTAPILVATGSNGFDWNDAGIGAGIALALVLLLLLMRRFVHRKPEFPSASRVSVTG